MYFDAFLSVVALLLQIASCHPSPPSAQHRQSSDMSKRQRPRLPEPKCFLPRKDLRPLMLHACVDQIHEMLLDERPREWRPSNFPWRFESQHSGCDITVGDTGSALEGISDVFSSNDVARAAYRVLETCARDHNFGRGGTTRIVRYERLTPPRATTGIVPIYVQNRAGRILRWPGHSPTASNSTSPRLSEISNSTMVS